MATVNNLDVVDFPLDAQVSAPLYQGRSQLAEPRNFVTLPIWGTTSPADITVGQLWPRGQRA